MSTTNQPAPAEPHKKPRRNGTAAELSKEAIRNLTGFFDVLIQMDLAQQQCNKRGIKDGINNISTQGKTVSQSIGAKPVRARKPNQVA